MKFVFYIGLSLLILSCDRTSRSVVSSHVNSNKNITSKLLQIKKIFLKDKNGNKYYDIKLINNNILSDKEFFQIETCHLATNTCKQEEMNGKSKELCLKEAGEYEIKISHCSESNRCEKYQESIKTSILPSSAKKLKLLKKRECQIRSDLYASSHVLYDKIFNLPFSKKIAHELTYSTNKIISSAEEQSSLFLTENPTDNQFNLLSSDSEKSDVKISIQSHETFQIMPEKIQQALFSIIGFNEIIQQWAITQTKDIKEQLDFGIRAFDIRLTDHFWKEDKIIGFKHEAVKFVDKYFHFEDLLKAMKRFLKDNPDEIIFMQIHKAKIKSWDNEAAAKVFELIDGLKDILPSDVNISERGKIYLMLPFSEQRAFAARKASELNILEEEAKAITIMVKNYDSLWFGGVYQGDEVKKKQEAKLNLIFDRKSKEPSPSDTESLPGYIKGGFLRSDFIVGVDGKLISSETNITKSFGIEPFMNSLEKESSFKFNIKAFLENSASNKANVIYTDFSEKQITPENLGDFFSNTGKKSIGDCKFYGSHNSMTYQIAESFPRADVFLRLGVSALFLGAILFLTSKKLFKAAKKFKESRQRRQTINSEDNALSAVDRKRMSSTTGDALSQGKGKGKGKAKPHTAARKTGSSRKPSIWPFGRFGRRGLVEQESESDFVIQQKFFLLSKGLEKVDKLIQDLRETQKYFSKQYTP